MKFNSDNVLIRSLAGGDVNALDVIYVRFAPQVRAFLHKVVGGLRSEDIEDITQDIFLKIWNSRSSLKEDEPLSPYIFKIARNAALNELKHNKVAQKYAQSLQAAAESASQAGPDRALEARQSLQMTKNVIENLDERQRSIFLANRLEKKTYGEIAEEMNLSPRTVQYHISDVLRKLRSKTS